MGHFNGTENPASPTDSFFEAHNEYNWPITRLLSLGRLHARQIRRLAKIQQGEEVVELGAGYPILYRIYSKDVGSTGHFYAVDINENIIRRSERISKVLDAIFPLRRTRGRERFICADANNLPFADDSKDLVIASNLTAGDGNYYAYSEAYRVLKPGGHIITSFGDVVFSHQIQDRDVKSLQHLGFINIKRKNGLNSIGFFRNRFVIAEKPIN